MKVIVLMIDQSTLMMLKTWEQYLRSYKKWLWIFSILVAIFIISQPIFIFMYATSNSKSTIQIIFIVHVSEFIFTILYVFLWALYGNYYIKSYVLPCPNCGFLSDLKKIDPKFNRHIIDSVHEKRCICMLDQE